MADDASCDIWFVNGMLPWTEDMLSGSESSQYAQQLYQGLSEHEVQDFKQRLQNNLELIDWNQWINPWLSIPDMQIDNAPLDTHPGPGTHAKLAEMILDVIDNIDT
jgi:hypothetical protein